MDAIKRKPPKLNLTELTNGETLFVQFNPNQLKRQVKANYARKQVLGQSHEPMQYTGTSNSTFTLDLFYDALDADKPSVNPFGVSVSSAFELGQEARKFLEALLYPETLDGQILSEPPDVLVVWPKTMSLVCKAVALEFTDERFNSEGAVIQFTARVSFEESRNFRLNYSDVRSLGAFRSKREMGEST